MIDPVCRTVVVIELPDGDAAALARMRELVGGELEGVPLDDVGDSIWVRGDGLSAGRPVHAFKLRDWRDPFAGVAIVVGADPAGRSAPPQVPLRFLKAATEWLGEIIPETTWVDERHGVRAVVTYTRVK